MKPHTHIIGLGNPVAGDDAIGLHLAEDLQARFSGHTAIKISPCVQTGLYLLDLLEGFQSAILIDSIVDKGRRLGEVLIIDLPEEHTLPVGVSPHFIGIQSVLSLGRKHHLQMPRDLLILGIVIHDDQQLEEKLSPELISRYSDILSEIIHYINQTNKKSHLFLQQSVIFF
jgi:hydrogenase maturation protease